MNKQIKDVLQLVALLLPLFGLAVFGWLHSPMYADAKAENMLAVQEYLKMHYYDGDFPFRQNMINDFGFTEDEITPRGIIELFVDETPPNQNLGALK